MARSMMALVAAMALALQLMLPMSPPAAAQTTALADCHADAAAHHGGKHDAPSGRAGCDWCMLCGKLGTAVGPLDRVADLPQRVAAPVAVVAAAADLGHVIGRPRTGSVGARAPPEIA
ncbi:hypothetical protein [Pleomorphomonas carboxyditropha]|nr:hypothetical protein [Pleomorphomonas carboxyditropha]